MERGQDSVVEPLDLTARPPRSCYAELDGLMLMPRTIDKLRGSLPGGNAGSYWINTTIQGISGFLLTRLAVSEHDLRAAVAGAASDDDVAAWLRERVDVGGYPAINETLRRIKPHHAQDEAVFRAVYAETLAAHPELVTIVDIIDADDRRLFPPGA